MKPAVLRNIKPIDVEGDGNCFARAICVARGWSSERHMEIRFAIVEELENYPKFYTEMSIDNHETLRTVASKNGQYLWMDHLFAYCNAVNIAIALHAGFKTREDRFRNFAYTFIPFRRLPEYFHDIRKLKFIHIAWSAKTAEHSIAFAPNPYYVIPIPATVFLIRVAERKHIVAENFMYYFYKTFCVYHIPCDNPNGEVISVDESVANDAKNICGYGVEEIATYAHISKNLEKQKSLQIIFGFNYLI